MSNAVKDKGGRPPGEEKEQISPRLPLPLIARLKETAELNKRPISAEVEIALEEHLDREEDKREKSG